MAKTKEPLESQLPTYSVKRSVDFPSWLVVTCPYEDCGDVFLVRASRWLKPMRRTTHSGDPFTITGRSCPYCMRVSHKPRVS
jgi:hypothetical protein